MSPLLVLKLGSSVLPTEDALPEAVGAVYRHVRRGTRVIVVVSAIGRSTDELHAQALRWSASPSPSALAGLLATGEARAKALLCLALDRAGVPSVGLDPGLRTTGDPLDAEPIGLDADAIRRALDAAPVVVVPGFVGRDDEGRPTVLGRGGSDLTALFLADRLGARCRLCKDVDGVHAADPALAPGAPRYATLAWDDADGRVGRVVQEKALRFARSRSLPFEVGSADGPATLVGAPATTLGPAPERRPLRVTLLGLGTVGGGVLGRLLRRPERFEVVACAVRDPARHPDVPAGLLHADPSVALAVPSDVVVEAIGGLSPARELVLAALRTGRHVVTANKAIVALHGPELLAAARAAGRTLSSSAAVGGAVPAIEAAQRCAGRVSALEGVLNGTTNHVLDDLLAGRSLVEAVDRARSKGLCEADPRADLDGTDARHKLAILARHAFGEELGGVPTVGITALAQSDLATARGRGEVIRLVARCRREDGRLVARVGPEALPATHPLARLRGEENGLLLHLADRTERLVGRGAGRWPTAESVLADLDAVGGAP